MDAVAIAGRIRQLGFRGARRAVVRRLRAKLGLATSMRTADRVLLEQSILPWLNQRAAGGRVLLVGCDWYTAHYHKLLPACRVTTIDPDSTRAVYGAPRHHVARLEALDRHEPAGAFAGIVCNGVYGWGLDLRDHCEQAFDQCWLGLQPGGLLILGWNDVPARDPAPLSSIASLDRFEPLAFPPMGASRGLVADSTDRHTFAFFQRAPVS